MILCKDILDRYVEFWKFFKVKFNTKNIGILKNSTVIMQEIPVTQDFHIAMGIPEKVAEMIAERVGSTVDVFCSSLQEIFSCHKGEVIDFCTNNIEVEHLSEIRECLFHELIIAFPTLNGYQLCGRRNKKKQLLTFIRLVTVMSMVCKTAN